jgi:hypothetical protein
VGSGQDAPFAVMDGADDTDWAEWNGRKADVQGEGEGTGPCCAARPALAGARLNEAQQVGPREATIAQGGPCKARNRARARARHDSQ